MAILEQERERIRAEEELKELRVEQAKLAAAAAQLSAQMQVWPQQVNVTRKPQRPRMNSDVGRRKQDAWPKQEVANEWGGWDAGTWQNVEPTGAGADAGWGTAWAGNWENPNHHQPTQYHPPQYHSPQHNPPQHNPPQHNPPQYNPPQQKHENRKSRPKELNANNIWVDGWSAQPPAKDMMETGQKPRSRSRAKSFSVGQTEAKQRAKSRERADYWEQTKPEPEEKHQPRKLTKPAKVRFEMVDVPEQFRPYEPPDESKGTLLGFKRLFGRA